MQISISDLRTKILATFKEQGFPDDEATTIAEYLLWAEMSGIKTQGIIKMTGTEPLQKIQSKGDIKIERDTKLSQLLNGQAHPAPFVSTQAVEVCIEKAKEHGFGIVGVRNTFSSNGAQAYYAEKIAQQELIGIVCSRVASSDHGF